MKHVKRFRISRSQWIGVAVIASSVGLAYASALSVPHTFTAGDTVRAADMNANFQAVTAAVNDNFARITSPKTHRQLLAMNDFACRDPSAASCIPANHNGRWRAASSGTLLLVARLAMPEDAILNDVWCHFHDNSSADASFRVLRRDLTLAGPGWNVMTNAIATAGGANTIQTLQASSSTTSNWTTAQLTEDNQSRAFLVEITLPYSAFATLDAGLLALNGCHYEYTASGL